MGHQWLWKWKSAKSRKAGVAPKVPWLRWNGGADTDEQLMRAWKGTGIGASQEGRRGRRRAPCRTRS